MICVVKDGKRKYLSLGVSIHPKFWDFDKNKPKRNCPNKEYIQELINNKINEYSKHVLELKASNKEFTVSSLMKKTRSSIVKCTVENAFNEHIKLLDSEGRLKYASTFKELKASMLSYNKTLDIYFSDIDVEWLKSYEIWLKSNGLNLNSIGVRIRTLRVLYNKAMDNNFVSQECYPFNTYKVSKLHAETAKRAIAKDEIKKIISYKSKNKYTRLAIDILYFSYLCAGINFKDIAYLMEKNIVEGRLIYYRKKTKKLIKVPIQEDAMNIIRRYNNTNSKYIFPILSSFHKTDIQQSNRLAKVLSIVNKRLKGVGRELNIPIALTTYVARHSFATVLKRSGVSTSIISESLGHSSEKITQIYLDSFENKQIDEAMENLL